MEPLEERDVSSTKTWTARFNCKQMILLCTFIYFQCLGKFWFWINITTKALLAYFLHLGVGSDLGQDILTVVLGVNLHMNI